MNKINPKAILRNYGFSGFIDKNVVYVKGLHGLGGKLELEWSILAKEIHWQGWVWKEWNRE